jgi:hypothetical protein
VGTIGNAWRDYAAIPPWPGNWLTPPIENAWRALRRLGSGPEPSLRGGAIIFQGILKLTDRPTEGQRRLHLANRICPECGGRTHHSHTRGLVEKLIRAVTSRRMYRCHSCSWRGWASKANRVARKHRLRTLLSLLVTLLLTLLFAFYFLERMNQPPPPPVEPFIWLSLMLFF